MISKPAIVLLLALSSSLASGLTVRVDAAKGAPRLMVNGEPVRARMFYGGPGASALPVGLEWQHLEFDFTATGSATNGTMHLRFGPSAGDVFLDEIQVTDLTDKQDLIPLCDFEGGEPSFTRDWTFWPSGEANTVGHVSVEPGTGRQGSAGLHVKLTAPVNGIWPDFHVYHQTRLQITEGHRYHASLWVKAMPARSMSVEFHRPGKPYVHLGGPPDGFAAQIRLAAQAGVNFVTFPIGLPWPAPGEKEDWQGVDIACKTVLAANPKALLIPRIPMDSPEWWCAVHADEVMQWENGSHERYAVPASPVYRRDASQRLEALIRHLEQEFGDHIAGYHPAGQNTGEWFYEATWKPLLNGYAEADLTAWRAWLRGRYSSDEALRKAWKDATATIETAIVPTALARHASPAGVFRDPATEKAILDWGDFQQEAMADCVCGFAKVAREASQGRKLVLFFYGYVFELAGVTNGPATAGHFALRRVLDSPDIDVLCAPISYFDRGLGGGAPAMSATESVALAGKMWLNEDDTHTYLATGTPPGSRDHVTSLEETNAELTRNVAQEAVRNFATWWMDLTQTGWFKDAGMWRRMADLHTLDETLMKNPAPFLPEVADVVDEQSLRRVAPRGYIASLSSVYNARAALGRMGAPYGQYLMDDLLARRFQSKLYVLTSAWSLGAAERDKLLQATKGAARVWCYAPGYFEGDRMASPEAMRQLTGFTLTPSPAKAMATPTPAGRELGLQRRFGIDRPLNPLFAVADARPGEVLATYEDGSAAVVMRRQKTGVSIFVGVPVLTSELLRLAAREAGVHLFTATDCNVYANDPFLAIHASQDGPVELNTGRTGEVTDMLTGKVIGQGPAFTLPLKRGETMVLRY